MFKKKNNVNYYIKKGDKNLKNGNITKAKNYYLKGLSIDTNNITLMNNLSQIYTNWKNQ